MLEALILVLFLPPLHCTVNDYRKIMSSAILCFKYVYFSHRNKTTWLLPHLNDNFLSISYFTFFFLLLEKSSISRKLSLRWGACCVCLLLLDEIYTQNDAKLLNRVNHRVRLFHTFLCVDRHHPAAAAAPEATIASMMNVCSIVWNKLI